MRIPTFSQFQIQAEQLNKLYNDMNRLYIKSITNEKISASSEDPVLASQIKAAQNTVDEFDNYSTNVILASQRNQLINTSIQSTIDMLTDIQIQLSKVQSGTTNDNERALIATSLQANLNRMLSFANTQDANGNYIFSGFSANVQPFAYNAGTYQYQGGLSQSTISIGPNVTTLFYENGFNVFNDIFNGNGAFTVTAAGTNTGGSSTTAGSIDPSLYIADTYTLTVVQNGAGNVAYQVIGANSGQVIPPLPASIPNNAPDMVADSDISFNGVNFHMYGQPNIGDVFTVQPSTQENIFNALQDLISTLNEPLTNHGVFDQTISQLSSMFSQASEHLINYQTELGANAAAIDAQSSYNATQKLEHETARDGLKYEDSISISTEMAQKSFALQVTQESYARLQAMFMQLMQIHR